MQCAPAAAQVEGAACGPAVDREHASDGVDEALCRRDEAVLKSRCIKRNEDEAKLIVARRAVGKRQKATQKRELLPAEQGGAHPAIGAAQYRAQRQKQDFVERIKHLDGPVQVGELRKMRKRIKLLKQPRQPLLQPASCTVIPKSRQDTAELEFTPRRWPKLVRMPYTSRQLGLTRGVGES